MRRDVGSRLALLIAISEAEAVHVELIRHIEMRFGVELSFARERWKLRKTKDVDTDRKCRK